MKRHFELEIETLQNAPRDADKLKQLLQVKEREYDQAMHIEDTQRLVTEIEMLKFVLYLVNRKQKGSTIRTTTIHSHNQVLLYLLQLH
jgi:hypothetical protein